MASDGVKAGRLVQIPKCCSPGLLVVFFIIENMVLRVVGICLCLDVH